MCNYEATNNFKTVAVTNDVIIFSMVGRESSADFITLYYITYHIYNITYNIIKFTIYDTITYLESKHGCCLLNSPNLYMYYT